jgi:hypothetical protein
VGGGLGTTESMEKEGETSATELEGDNVRAVLNETPFVSAGVSAIGMALVVNKIQSTENVTRILGIRIVLTFADYLFMELR